MKYHKDGSKPTKGEVFVFGSNVDGLHYGGAAAAAFKDYGAEWGVAAGRTGNSYAIPTVDLKDSTARPLNVIAGYVHNFKVHAELNPSEDFFVTAIGCGIAGFKHAQIAPLFKGAPTNCNFPEEWKEFLE